MVQSLLYWNRNVDLDISSWIPYGVDYSPVSANRLHSDRLARIASFAMDMDSELLFLRSFQSGNGGTLFRDHLYDPDRSGEAELGFTLVFTYSKAIEDLLAGLEAKYGNIPSSPWPIYAADAVNILAYSVNKVGSTDSAKLAAYLRNNVNRVPGITGPIGFTKDGDREGVPFYLYKVDASGRIVVTK